uniref:Uncharacterized protein n=1 Tax=Oryza brachyantha TaxID=4533 RepID=J3M7K6_ORYBR
TLFNIRSNVPRDFFCQKLLATCALYRIYRQLTAFSTTVCFSFSNFEPYGR